MSFLNKWSLKPLYCNVLSPAVTLHCLRLQRCASRSPCCCVVSLSEPSQASWLPRSRRNDAKPTYDAPCFISLCSVFNIYQEIEKTKLLNKSPKLINAEKKTLDFVPACMENNIKVSCITSESKSVLFSMSGLIPWVSEKYSIQCRILFSPSMYSLSLQEAPQTWAGFRSSVGAIKGRKLRRRICREHPVQHIHTWRKKLPSESTTSPNPTITGAGLDLKPPSLHVWSRPQHQNGKKGSSELGGMIATIAFLAHPLIKVYLWQINMLCRATRAINVLMKLEFSALWLIWIGKSLVRTVYLQLLYQSYYLSSGIKCWIVDTLKRKYKDSL